MILTGDTGGADIGALKTVTASHTTVNETVIETPVELPTGTYPITPQVSFTIGEDGLPTVTGAQSFNNLAVAVASGRNNTGASATIYWRVRKNGASTFSGSTSISISIPYWTFNDYHYKDVVAGDVLEMFFYAGAVGVDLSFYGCYTVPAQINIGHNFMRNAVFKIYDGVRDGTPFVAGSRYYSTALEYIFYPSTSDDDMRVGNGTFTFRILQPNDARYTGATSVYYSPTYLNQTHATASPYYAVPLYIAELTYREYGTFP